MRFLIEKLLEFSTGYKEELDSITIYIDKIENVSIKMRIEHILKMYARKSTLYRWLYYRMSVLIIIINALIPVINQISSDDRLKYVVSIMSAVASVFAGIITLYCMKDTWYRYRKNAELIKKECMYFNSKIGDYSGEDRESYLTMNIEKILSEEKNSWKSQKFSQQDK